MSEKRVVLTDGTGAEIDVEWAKLLLGDHLAIRIDSEREEFETPPEVYQRYRFGRTWATAIELVRRADGYVLESLRDVPGGERVAAMRGLLDRIEAGEFNPYLLP